MWKYQLQQFVNRTRLEVFVSHFPPGTSKWNKVEHRLFCYFDNYRYYIGSTLATGNIYPSMYARTFFEGMKREDQTKIVNLIRCAWAGAQRYGALVWSGDIHSSFESFRNQLAAGLNMGIAGIPWWTTDIGGFHGADIQDPAFHELLILWFQWGCFCPVMRPLFYDFPGDGRAWETEDEYMFGPDYLVAPILYPGKTERQVYLPAGVRWTDCWNGEEYDGGGSITAGAPLNRIPVYSRNNRTFSGSAEPGKM
jgi:alpha-glucosidase (family GH31 glycosyl hydrolase)